MDKVLSVSIAAYNIAATLREVLEPFLMEDVLDRVDVMIVDDGSKDDTAKIAMEYQEKYPNTFRLISKPNGGWGSTLNTGMRAAVGKYFKQLDGDDYFSYENLSDYLTFLEKTDADVVHTPFVTYSDASGGILQVLNDFSWQDYVWYPKERTLPLADCPKVRPEMHNLAVKVSLLKENDVTITEHCFYTDVEFSLKAFAVSKTIAFYERPIYYYRLAFSGQSMGLGGIRKHYMDNQKMLMGMLDYRDNQVTEQWAKEMINNRLTSVCDLMYRMFFALQCNAKQKQQLREFDRMLKEKDEKLYKSVNSLAVRFLRKFNFFGYWFIGHRAMNKDRRLKRNFFEGE